MPNCRLSLTDEICEDAEPETREYALRDIQMPGLILRVQPGGSKSWMIRLRENGKQKKRWLGSFPMIGVQAARQAALAAFTFDLTALSARSSSPFFQTFQAEHEQLCKRTYKPSGLRTYRSYVRNQLLPAFGDKRLDRITRPAIVAWFEQYSQTSPGGANRALGILSRMLAVAQSWGHLPDDWVNPAIGIRHNRRRFVGSFLSGAQLECLGTVLRTRIANDCAAASLLWFLALTGCRVGEAIDLTWDDVLNDRLQLRSSKTGPREVALGNAAAAFLREHRRRSRTVEGTVRSGAVFQLAGGQRYDAVRTAWNVIRRKAGLPGSFRIHDLRHSFASYAVMSGETLFVTSRLLGHRRVQSTARYAHLSDGTLLDAAEQIGDLIMLQATGAIHVPDD